MTALTISSGNRVRTFRIPGWLLVVIVAAIGVLLPGYIAATGYLIFRDGLLGASISRQVAIQYAYEDRIAALRTELNRATSRHLVQTQGVEDQVGILLERQAHIDRRQQILDSLIATASQNGITIAPTGAPTLRRKPESAAMARPASVSHALGYAAEQHTDDVITGSLLRDASASRPAAKPDSERLKPLLQQIQSSLESTQKDQGRVLDAIMGASQAETERLTAALSRVGAGNAFATGAASGGPFIPAQPMHFVEKSAMLEQLLKQLSGIRRYASTLPLRKPISGPASSTFGNRLDPFLGKPAMHAGMDIVAGEGSPVKATGPGTVVSADWSGGYGRLVEIRHVDGVTTRYAHLSAFKVAAGDKVRAGTVIGLVGSTGRSTGPHLHYETRRSGRPVDPAIYLAAGRAF